MKQGTLYVVSTPIGNRRDISERAIEVLKDVDLIAAEDTRHTGILLKHFGISSRMISYYDQNERKRAPELVGLLQAGQSVALVSDAGTPTISDPGYHLVKQASEAGLPVVPIPGASSLLSALVVSGLPTDRFIFEGFLPRKKGRKTALEKIAEFDGSVVIFESGHRIERTLHDLRSSCGNRKVAVCRELTKKFETIYRGNLDQVLDKWDEGSKKGEFVVVIGKAGLA
ncbi:16S rRNA (cytidine(1402)-2'-O)-methyltransferase [Candidatus Neomarinimicrobiota bacterium]